jgi:23S rRNA (uridine2552-2'-O)-methyltransferase
LTECEISYMKRRPSGHKYQPDFYAQKARKEKFPARSVYKLKEIQQKHRLIRKGDRILDLGCAPGSWLQYAAELTGPRGVVVGVDLKPVAIPVPSHARAIEADVSQLAEMDRGTMVDIIGEDYHLVMSDMAPSTTGHKRVDAVRSHQLCEAALGIARYVLVEGGVFICKIFQGPDFTGFVNAVRADFSTVKIFKPQSCRKESREIYIIGIGKTGGSEDGRAQQMGQHQAPQDG